MNKTLRIMLLLLAVLFLAVCSTTRQAVEPATKTAPARAMEPDDLIPVDPDILIGRLENGLTYYLKNNYKPEKRAELRLVVKAGSVLEDDNQRGMAHFAEHMAFNGTENFNKQELVDYLESIGMRFGPDLNAYTSFDETVYMLQVPTDSVEIVETAFQILEDWAHRVSYEGEEIDRERGVVIEEWRSGRGASARMFDKQFPILLQASKYADRLPIGKVEVIESFEHDTLRRFYRDWYRSDLMAVVAVGDFDRSLFEQLIREHFSRLSPVKNPRKRTSFPVPGHEETLFAIATDPEATSTSVGIYYKHDVEPENRVADYRRNIIEGLYNAMFNQRLEELTKQADPPFLYASSGSGRFIRTKEFYVLSAGVKENGIERGLETILTAAERIRRYGFSDSELDRQKKETLRSMERAYNERDKSESYRFAAEFIRNFLMGEPIPGIEYEYELFKKYVPGITLEEVNALAERLITDQNRVITVNGPEKTGVAIPGETELLAVFDSVAQKTIEPYVDTFSEKPLIATPLSPLPITDEREIEELGVTEWRLANGITVVLKPTDFKNDEVIFTSFSPGGSSLVPDENIIPATTATSVVTEGGVGDFTKIDLEKALSGKVVSVSPWISELQEGISGSASPRDLETMFQLIHLYLTVPRRDSEAFQSYTSRIKGYIENRSASPEAAFSDTIMVTMTQYHPRVRPWTLHLIDEMDLDASYAIYRDRFADAGDFTFFFVGNFAPDTIRPLMERYLGSLPSQNREETWLDTGIEPPKGVIAKSIYRGIEDKCRVSITFTGPFSWNRQNRYDLQSMIGVLRIRLREVLREDMGGTYGVGVSASFSHYPDQEYTISIGFGCDPERAEELITSVFSEIETIKETGAGEEYLTKVKENQRREHEINLKQNSFWLSNLSFYYYHGEDPLQILEFDSYVDGFSSATVQTAARQYFDMNNYVRVVLYPEGSQQTAPK